MLVRYLPLIFVLAALLLALAPLEAAAQPAPGARQADGPRPKAAGAPINAGADNTAIPPGADARQVRPAQAFPPERFAISPDPAPRAPSRGGVQAPDRPATASASKDDPRSVEERPDPGG
jgi:hypothetical protein